MLGVHINSTSNFPTEDFGFLEGRESNLIKGHKHNSDELIKIISSISIVFHANCNSLKLSGKKRIGSLTLLTIFL